MVVFSANRFVSNGRVPDITHIVYVNPETYGAIDDFGTLKEIGRLVGRLNKVLPKRQFVLMGPGRWGSRGDIRLGVDVTYSDINNAAVLIEIARQKDDYLPDLSFGTHFFQDLVEADIRYIPLYPDTANVTFNSLFFERSRNILAKILPNYAHLANKVCVIDVPEETDGRILRVLMNADLDEAVAFLDRPTEKGESNGEENYEIEETPQQHWRWRSRMAERIAACLDPDLFGVKAMYVFGSTKNSTAGPGSDLDLLIHVDGNEQQRKELSLWLDGWSRSLGEINYLRTGYQMDGLLDIHYITNEDVEKRTSYAAKIDAITDAAKPLSLGGSEGSGS
jgi:hypothetical protein